MRTAFGIALASSLGGLVRYWVEGIIRYRTGGGFPWGTFVVNVTGTFLLGLLFTVLSGKLDVAAWVRSAITIGFLGAYTTFSTLSRRSD
jgi:CrcB protein